MNVDKMLEEIESFLDSRRQRPKAVRVLDAILGIADRGRDHLKIWESLRTLAHEDPALVDVATMFFLMTAIAHIEAATLHAAKLVETQQDSVNITYLLNEIEAARNQSFLRDSFTNVRPVVAAARSRLQHMQQTVIRIKDKRDRDLAHLDRSHINTADESQAIDAKDLYEVFDAVREIARDLAVASSGFEEVTRSLSADPGDHFGPVDPADFIYFARMAFRNPTILSPNPRVENLRAFDRAVRQAKGQAESLGRA